MMLKLFKENIRIHGSIRTQLLRTVLTVLIIAIGITALVTFLRLFRRWRTYPLDFASMGSQYV
jgi:putative ABC transport system permease protein